MTVWGPAIYEVMPRAGLGDWIEEQASVWIWRCRQLSRSSTTSRQGRPGIERTACVAYYKEDKTRIGLIEISERGAVRLARLVCKGGSGCCPTFCHRAKGTSHSGSRFLAETSQAVWFKTSFADGLAWAYVRCFLRSNDA